MKIFEIQHPCGGKEWVCGNTLIEMLKFYLNESWTNIHEIDDMCDIIMLPEEKWGDMQVTNEEYNPNDPDDFEMISLKDMVKGCDSPEILASTFC